MNKLLTKTKIINIAGFLTLAIFFLSDRWLKHFSLGGLDFVIIPKFLNFHFFANRNIAFSLPLEGVWLTIVITLIIALLIFYFFRFYSQLNKLTLFGLGAIIVGALSNLSDRLFYGFVIDYLDLSRFTIFNLADILIVSGTIFLFWGLVTKDR